MSLISNSDVPDAIRKRHPFETKVRNLRGFTDVMGRYGVVSYGTTIALEIDGALRLARPGRNVYSKHLELVETSLEGEHRG